jgi:hypothetical protein
MRKNKRYFELDPHPGPLPMGEGEKTFLNSHIPFALGEGERQFSFRMFAGSLTREIARREVMERPGRAYMHKLTSPNGRR